MNLKLQMKTVIKLVGNLFIQYGFIGSSAVFPGLSLGPECSMSKTSKGGIINSYLEWQLHNHDCPRRVGYTITLITGNLYCKEEGSEITLGVQSSCLDDSLSGQRVSCTYMKHLCISHKLSSLRIDDFLLLTLGTNIKVLRCCPWPSWPL